MGQVMLMVLLNTKMKWLLTEQKEVKKLSWKMSDENNSEEHIPLG